MSFKQDFKAINCILNPKRERERERCIKYVVIAPWNDCNGNFFTSWILLNDLEDLDYVERIVIPRSYLDVSRKLLGWLTVCVLKSQVAHSNYTFHKHGSLPISIMVVRVSLVELGNLNNLLELHLSSNKLIGTIPSNIGKLKKLVLLDLEYNMLIGPIPFSLGYLTSLTYLSLGSNLINGSIHKLPI